MPTAAALAESTSEMYFSRILKEASMSWVKRLARDSLSAIDGQMLFEKLLLMAMGPHYKF